MDLVVMGEECHGMVHAEVAEVELYLTDSLRRRTATAQARTDHSIMIRLIVRKFQNRSMGLPQPCLAINKQPPITRMAKPQRLATPVLDQEGGVGIVEEERVEVQPKEQEPETRQPIQPLIA